ncbi:ribonuclease P protein subunit p25-like protein [Tanacetum coccineum]
MRYVSLARGRMRNYITYAMTLLEEKGSSEIVLKAMGRAINKTVTVVELIKVSHASLLYILETTRHVSLITITLSKKELDTSSIGYQPPWPADQVKASPEFEYKGGYVEL